MNSKGKAPFCASAEKFCFAYIHHGITACENCPYSSAPNAVKMEDEFRTAFEILREKRK